MRIGLHSKLAGFVSSNATMRIGLPCKLIVAHRNTPARASDFTRSWQVAIVHAIRPFNAGYGTCRSPNMFFGWGGGTQYP